MKENPLEGIRRLVEKVEQNTEHIGLEMIGSAVIPGRDGIPDMLQVMFKLDPEVIAKTDEERAELDMLKGIERETARAELERKEREAGEAAQRLADSLREGDGGLGFDG